MDFRLNENKLNKKVKKYDKYNMSLNNIPKDIFKCISIYLKINDTVSLGLSSKLQRKLSKTAIHKYISGKKWKYESLNNLPIKLHKHVFVVGCQINNAGVFPKNLKKLYFWRKSNPQISSIIFPITLTHLDLGDLFNQPMDCLPPNLTHLTFGSNFNQQIGVGVLPLNLTHLTFEGKFNQPIGIGVLPPNLTHLMFGYAFNQPIGMGVLPPNLTHLTFQNTRFNTFNQPIEIGVLPQKLTHLEFGRNYNKQIKNGVLPTSLTHLILGEYFQMMFTDGLESLSLGITHLTFMYHFYIPIYKGFFSKSITHLEIFNCWENNSERKISKQDFPPNLKHLTFYDDINYHIGVDVLPSSLTHLSINSCLFNQPIGLGVLPVGLTHLDVGWGFNQPIEVGVLPQSLKHLEFGSSYNKLIGDGVLPTNLEYLGFGGYKYPNGVLNIDLNYLKNKPLN